VTSGQAAWVTLGIGDLGCFAGHHAQVLLEGQQAARSLGAPDGR
jgi:hypothetical protein